MMRTFREAFLNAWSMLIEFPLPYLNTAQENEIPASKDLKLLIQICFPVVGFVCALLALLLGFILLKFLYPIPASAVFAGILTYFCVYKDDGRGLAGLMMTVVSRQKKIPLEQTLYNLPDNLGDVNAPIATLTMILVVLFKLFAFYLMAYYGYIYWLVAVCVLEFAIEGDLAAIPSIGTGSPLLDIKKSKHRYVWFTAGFLTLFVLFEAPIPVLILFGVAFGLSHAVKTYCQEHLGGIDSKMIGLTAYVFELLALLLGMVLLTRGL